MVLRQTVRRNGLEDIFLRLLRFARRHKSTGDTVKRRTGPVHITGSLIQLITMMQRFACLVILAHAEIGCAQKGIDVALGYIIHLSETLLCLST